MHDFIIVKIRKFDIHYTNICSLVIHNWTLPKFGKLFENDPVFYLPQDPQLQPLYLQKTDSFKTPFLLATQYYCYFHDMIIHLLAIRKRLSFLTIILKRGTN